MAQSAVPRPGQRGRALAFDILRRVERQGAFASILLQNVSRDIPAREVALATELVYGTLRHRLHDEHLLARFAERPVSEIDPEVAILFRIATHQILRLDRIPDRAAVHEAVEATRGLRGGSAATAPQREGAARFLNAVLRRLCREKGALPLPPAPDPGAADSNPDAAARALSIRRSHPEWLVRRYLTRLGPVECDALLAANNRPAAMGVRVDLARTTTREAAFALAAEGVETIPSSWLPSFLRVLQGVPHRTTAFRQGWIYVQDEASGIVPHLVAPIAGARVLDACSAPGGKALALARMVGGAGLVVAGDAHPARLHLVAENARRLRISNVTCVAGDFSQSPPVTGPFDAILVDAPCSGTGVFRRDVELRYRLAPDDLPALARRQLALIESLAPLLRPGGRLVYSVCSIEPEEGPEVVEAFLARRPGYRRLDLAAALPAHPGLFAADGTLRTLPHRDDLDGFFAAGMVKTGKPS
ncbi:MAG TPA: 16S rRNA (cytosine(967)-C(5))-methyltransferase RsmB [Verrucomicrobiae bacterium]|nr:16S rRNA (cytosine(967)-C(5))-methyltransferase RsmB [Verrucomicrobiae bacterium]